MLPLLTSERLSIHPSGQPAVGRRRRHRRRAVRRVHRRSRCGHADRGHQRGSRPTGRRSLSSHAGLRIRLHDMRPAFQPDPLHGRCGSADRLRRRAPGSSGVVGVRSNNVGLVERWRRRSDGRRGLLRRWLRLRLTTGGSGGYGRCMDDRLIARLIAAGRVLFGLLCIAAPKLVLQKEAAATPSQAVFMLRLFGVRDVVLGAGALASLNEDEPGPGLGAHGGDHALPTWSPPWRSAGSSGPKDLPRR